MPTLAHMAVAQLANARVIDYIITTNTDGLHRYLQGRERESIRAMMMGNAAATVIVRWDIILLH